MPQLDASPGSAGSGDHPGHGALAALDRVISQKPHKDGHGLSETMMCLTRFRDEMVAADHGSAGREERERLARLNAIIGVVYGAHFPLGNVPWGEVEKARGWLSDLVQEIEP
ncbi:hypothetical protein ACRAWG_10060 [Methylobacterium sp. P31]